MRMHLLVSAGQGKGVRSGPHRGTRNGYCHCERDNNGNEHSTRWSEGKEGMMENPKLWA